MQSHPFLSIVIPARNEETRLPNTMEKVFSFLETQPYTAEVIVVENSSTDRTAEIAARYAAQHEHTRLLREPEPGKGNAVRKGMLAARGQFRFMADADLSMPIEELPHFLPPVLTNFDIAIGSREAPGAIRYNEPYYRHLGGRAVNLMIRILALPGLHDTQCGFKCFRAAVAEDLFRHQTLGGWSFDVELLYIARLRGYRIVEVPISWHYQAESKVNPLQDTFRMGIDILEILRNARRGVYNNNHEPHKIRS